MAKVLVFLILSFLLVSKTQAQKDKIRWLSTSQLNWSDFKDRAPSKSPMAAETSTHLDFSLSFANGKFSWALDCYFTPSESWYKMELKDDNLLDHEQLHFDIAELNARLIRKEMEGLDLRGIEDQKKLQKSFENGYKKMSEMQLKYDKETNHGQKSADQSRWANMIREDLPKFESFATKNYSFQE